MHVAKMETSVTAKEPRSTSTYRFYFFHLLQLLWARGSRRSLEPCGNSGSLVMVTLKCGCRLPWEMSHHYQNHSCLRKVTLNKCWRHLSTFPRQPILSGVADIWWLHLVCFILAQNHLYFRGSLRMTWGVLFWKLWKEREVIFKA